MIAVPASPEPAPPTSVVTALAADRVSCRRGERLLFRDLSFRVPSGRTLLVRGPNGVGKTSLLRVLAGLLRAEAGHVRAEGAEVDLPLATLSHFIGPRDGIKPSLTVREHVAFWRRLLAAGGEETADDAAMEAWGLSDRADLPAGYLSSGFRRRLALARLSAVPRPIWLLDEPTNALDEPSFHNLVAAIDRFTARGGIAVVATHTTIPLTRADVLTMEPS